MTDQETIFFKSAYLPTFGERGFQPILERFCGVLDGQQLQPIETLEGKSIKSLSEGIAKPFLKGFFKPFRMDKCEKITLCNCLMMDRIQVSAVIAIPQDDYDLPMPVLEWSETENAISVLVDFIPLVDLVMREDYREKYIDPLDQFWSKYKDLPGMKPNRFAWARQMFSPYYLCGHFSKDSRQNIDISLEIMQQYLELWMNLWQDAEPIEDVGTRQSVQKRKTKIREIFRKNDEGAKSISQMVGQEIVDLILICYF